MDTYWKDFIKLFNEGLEHDEVDVMHGTLEAAEIFARSISNEDQIIAKDESYEFFNHAIKYVTKENKEDVVEQLKTNLNENVSFSKRDRVYIVWREGSKIRGKFIFGSRKSPPWAGYGPYESAPEESI